MQSLGDVTTEQLLGAGQAALIKFEAYIGDHWQNICDVQKERLTDGGMELWDDDTHLTHWTEFDAGGACGVAREAAEIHDGSFSCKLWTTAQGDYAGINEEFTLTPGNKCKMTVWYLRPAHASSKLRLYIQTGASWTITLQSDASWTTDATYITLPETAVWLKYELEFTAHPDYSDYRIKFYKDHIAGGGEISYYVDSASLGEFRDLSLGIGEGGNYLESASISLGGAGKTPNPVAGSWDASILNEDGIFHPQHPNSAYKDWLKTQRKIRISVGGRYADVDYYWQRLIGFMDIPKFSSPDYKVAINGGDYMKLLQEFELRHLDNFWGDSETFPSIPSDGLIGSELYIGQDAMDAVNEEDDVDDWVTSNCTFVCLADDGGGSTYVGKITNTGGPPHYVKKLNVGSATEGKQHRVKFKHRIPGGDGLLGIRIEIHQASGCCEHVIYFPTDDWKEEILFFTALDTGVIEMRFYASAPIIDLRLDQISIQGFTPYWERYYELLGLTPTSKGPYHITLDGDPVWQGEKDEGWFYDPEEDTGEYPHPAEIVFFDPNKTIPSGVDVVIYYFTAQSPENVVADLLVKIGLYVDRAAALDAMDYDATEVTIDKVWFKPGSKGLNAINKLCERCDYRFYFKYDGTPVFKPKPTAGEQVFTFTDPKHISSVNTYQDRNEIKNRIVITGMKQAEPINKEETMPPELKGEAHDQDSIDEYGERTLTINNHLFQTQASINAMKATLLAEYKDPKWYSDVEVPFNPVPIEMADTIGWKERLSPLLNISQEGIVRDIKIDNFNTTYVCEL